MFWNACLNTYNYAIVPCKICMICTILLHVGSQSPVLGVSLHCMPACLSAADVHLPSDVRQALQSACLTGGCVHAYTDVFASRLATRQGNSILNEGVISRHTKVTVENSQAKWCHRYSLQL